MAREFKRVELRNGEPMDTCGMNVQVSKVLICVILNDQTDMSEITSIEHRANTQVTFQLNRPPGPAGPQLPARALSALPRDVQPQTPPRPQSPPQELQRLGGQCRGRRLWSLRALAVEGRAVDRRQLVPRRRRRQVVIYSSPVNAQHPLNQQTLIL